MNRRIDAHRHFKPLINDTTSFQIESLKKEIVESGFDGCIITQSGVSERETDILLEISSQHNFIKGIIAGFNFNSEKSIDALNQYCSNPKLLGIQINLKNFSPKDFYNKKFKDLIDLLQKKDLLIEIEAEPRDLKILKPLVEFYPDQRFILNYIGKPFIDTGILIPWADDVFELAKNANLFCKVNYFTSTLTSTLWKKEQLEPFLMVIYHAFGFERILFGSNSNSFSSVKIIEESLSKFSSEDQENVFGKNAIKIYRII